MAFVEIAKLGPIFKPEAPTLKFGLSTVEAHKALERVKTLAERFEAVAGDLVKKHEAAACVHTAALIKEMKREILVLAIAPAIRAKYAPQLEIASDFDKVVVFVKATLGSELTAHQKLTEARDALKKAARFSENSEKFETFLERLQTLGKVVAGLTSEETAQMLIRDAWDRNITAQQRNFLVQHGQALSDEVNLETAAKFLDARRQHLPRAGVHNLEPSGVESLTAQVDSLAAQVAQLTSILTNHVATSGTPLVTQA